AASLGARVAISEVNPVRAELARRLDVGDVLNPAELDVGEWLRDRTGGVRAGHRAGRHLVLPGHRLAAGARPDRPRPAAGREGGHRAGADGRCRRAWLRGVAVPDR